MVRLGTPPEVLLSALASGQAVLCLGPGFVHPLPILDWGVALEGLRGLVPDTSGWDGLDLLDRAQLFIEAHGRERLESELAAALPSADVLRGQILPFQRQLVELPARIIISTTHDALIEAVLEEMDLPYRVVVEDADLEAALAIDDGARLVVKMNGDAISGLAPLLTRDDLLAYGRKRPCILAYLRALFLDKTFLLYGFGLNDPSFLTLYTEVIEKAPRPRTAFALMKEPNSLLLQHWGRRGVDIYAGNTSTDLERWVEGLHRESMARHRAQADLLGAVQAGLPEHRAAFATLATDLQTTLTRRLSTLSGFEWTRLSPAEIGAHTLGGNEAAQAAQILKAAVDVGLPVAPSHFALVAEMLLREGLAGESRRAVDFCLRTYAQRGERPPAAIRGLIGRILARMSDLERARPFLERALLTGEASDMTSRLSELAWLCRCVLDRADKLAERRRDRPRRELLGRFLVTFAPFFKLAQTPAPPVADEDGEGLRWSIYYCCYRLGRVFSLASELAGQSGAVYNQQAIEHLCRAIELSPAKPEPYRVVRPLLLAPRGSRPDAKRWERIVTAAPTDVQRKLQELDAPEGRGGKPKRT